MSTPGGFSGKAHLAIGLAAGIAIGAGSAAFMLSWHSASGPNAYETVPVAGTVSSSVEAAPVEAAMPGQSLGATESGSVPHVVSNGRQRIPLRDALSWTVSIRTEQTYGSGVVIAPGLALTAAHVVDGHDSVHLRFHQDGWRQVDVVAVDTDRDLALVATEQPDRPIAKLASLWRLEPGESIASLGSPRQMEFTAMRGIVSFIGRRIRSMRYLQTDITANPGSSGGPVIDESGNLIGIMAFILPDSSGLSFVIPIDYALLSFPDQLAAYGSDRDLDRFRLWAEKKVP